jgi:succinyl-CoA synthetase alpha subunit
VERFEEDDETEMMVLFGEIGTTQEERVADLIEKGKCTKPVIAYIGGKAAKSGTRFSHAGAIVEGTRGSYESKVERLKSSGVHVVDSVSAIPQVALTLKKGGA